MWQCARIFRHGFFTGRILSKDSGVRVEQSEIWISAFRFGTQESWDGSFEAPIVPALNAPASRLHLADGREGTMTPLRRWIKGENILVSFQGSAPLMARV